MTYYSDLSVYEFACQKLINALAIDLQILMLLNRNL